MVNQLTTIFCNDMIGLAWSTHVERISAPSALDFYRKYVSASQPVIITGFINHWPACNNWTPKYLKEKAGHLQGRHEGMHPTNGVSVH
jgi:hypothetical protein